MAFSLHRLLQASAERWPDRPALQYSDSKLTYAELEQRAAAVAHLLKDQGVRRGDRVAVYLNRGFNSLAAIFGVMQAGGVYVPLDSFAPPVRLAAILEDCEVRHLISEESYRDRLQELLPSSQGVRLLVGPSPAPDLGVKTVPWDEVYRGSPGPVRDTEVIEEDLCLIFYTSGSTGRPKGVAHSHRSMLSNVDWALDKYRLTPEDRLCHVTSHHFDLCWFEMYASMAAGSTLVLVPEATLKFPTDLAELISRERVSVWCSVPSVLISLVQRSGLEGRDLAALRWVLFAGERFPTKHLKELMSLVSHARYTNMYGTTESHIAAYYDVPRDLSDAPLPIGRACEHVNLVLLKPDGQPASEGEPGELAIRGPSLMNGYWRLPELTARALVKARIAPEVEATVYRTGDLARRTAEGLYELIGRADRRVKIRGYLVDLDEVEKVLLADDRIEEAAAFVASPEGFPWVEAAVLLKAGARALSSELRTQVARLLPLYAVPERVSILDSFARTGSGKISRRDLAAAIEQQRRRAAPPANDDPFQGVWSFLVEQVWDNREPFGLDEDNDLVAAGLIDSMGLVRLVAFLEEHFGVHIPNDDFTAENFATLQAIRRMVDRFRRKVQAGA